MPPSRSKSLPTLSIRIDFDPEGRIGPGKIELLERIEACGSIAAAGRTMAMSYKRAWDLVDEVNQICGQPAVARQTGGKNGGSASLTAFGKLLIERYRMIEHAATAAAKPHLVSLRSDIAKGQRAKS
ncbi:LysR family transcriptional regulator [Rhodopseudomonas sp. BR0C11]|uniref:winged helix-turn-helix domain-containing protein n=1 Tax=Rhodopseudomonas sp. BR0C11 TaxID=2269370 RepID=UPI0013DF6C32|nr:winged helix-turn-helix domain-containing protein [Rhodopseudomonas sp. BR0C11]NEV76875.1 LysR family transcriptional regulator [Rhodopseudomonas sp. BR0C11]